MLLAAELFVGALLLSALWNSALYIPIVLSAVAVVALLIWQLILFFKATDLSAKRKILCNIAFVMLIPSAVFFITYIVFAISFIIAFSN